MQSGGKHSRNDAVRISRCLNKCTPQYDTVSFSPIHSWRVLGSKCPRPWHCYSVHPIYWVHHPGWYPSLNFSLAPAGNLAMNRWCRGEGCNLNTWHDDTLLSPLPTLVCNGIHGVLIKDQEVDLHMASRFPVGASAMAWMPQSSWPLRHWWQSWCCAPITLESMIWQKQRQLGWSHP